MIHVDTLRVFALCSLSVSEKVSRNQDACRQNHWEMFLGTALLAIKGKPTIITSGLTGEHRVHSEMKEDL